MKHQKSKRDYRAEYARRVARGMAMGLSRSQARGHPKAREKNVRKPRPIPDTQLQISLRELAAGSSLMEAARMIHVSPERLRNQAVAQGAIRRHRGRWVVPKKLPRRMLIYSNGDAYPIMLGIAREASKVGRYMSAVRKFMHTNDPASLKPFIGKHATDMRGKTHVFETRPNAIYRLAVNGAESFEQVYRIVT
jgi:hypothetical protein